MGMRETAEQVARRMRDDGFGDVEIAAELTRRAEWPAEEIEHAIVDSRWTSSGELQAAVVAGDADARASVHRGVLLDLRAAEAREHLLTPEEELAIVRDPDAVLAEHGIAAATGNAAKRDMALAFARQRAAQDPQRCRAALRAAQRVHGAPPAPRTSAGTARPRERRERHVARATSSSDSGDDGPSDPSLAARLVRAIRRWGRP
jgi:hypothetical protein